MHFELELDNESLVVKQNNYLTNIVDAHVAYDLDNGPRNLLRKFILKN